MHLTRFFDPSVDIKYGALYNFDVHFSDQRGPVGVRLQANGQKTQYCISPDPAAPQGS